MAQQAKPRVVVIGAGYAGADVAKTLDASGSVDVTLIDPNDATKRLVEHPGAKYVVLFAMFYASTRKVSWSLAMLALYAALVHVLLNERHPLNVVSRPVTGADVEDVYRENLAKLAG